MTKLVTIVEIKCMSYNVRQITKLSD